MIKRISAVFLSLLFIVLVFGSCGKSGADEELYYPIYADPVSFDPQIASDNASKIVVYNCFEGLVRYNSDRKLVPGVAKSWEISSDGLTYTFHLRSDSKWYMSSYAKKLLDKKTADNFNYCVTADDFVYGLRRAFDPQMGAVSDGALYAIKGAYEIGNGDKPLDSLGVTAIDSMTLKIELTEPNEDFLAALTQTAAMPCREEFFLATKGKYGIDPETIIYNGPFYLYSWSQNSNLTLNRNDFYSGEAAVLPKTVYLYVNSDLSTRITKLDSGTYDVCPLSVSQKSKLKDNKISFLNYSNSTWALCFNCKSDLMSNSDLRSAICYATNTKDIVLPNYATEFSEGIVPSVCTIGGKSYRKSVGEIKRLSFSKKKSEQCLASAYNNLDIQFAEIAVVCPEDLDNLVRKIAQSWQKCLGVTVTFNIEALETSELDQRVKDGEFDIALTKIISDSENAASFLSKFSSTGGNSVFNFSSKSYDDLILGANSSINRMEIEKNCKNAEKMLIKDAVVYPLFCEDGYIGMAKGVSGIFCIEAGAIPVFLGGIRK